MSDPFIYLNQILSEKKDLIFDEATEKEYVPFLINRGLSYHLDCVMYANEMNKFHHLDAKLQNHFLINSIRAKKRRFMKWVKPVKSEDLACIKTLYQYSDTKAKEALALLSEKELQQLKEKADKGGLKK
jgi:hypothetical protein